MLIEPFILSFKLAGVTTLILFFIGVPLAWWLSQTQLKLKPLLEALVALPIVLPPTVIGFYLLWAFAPTSPLGQFLKEKLGIELVFSFEGIVLGSVIYSLPFMIQPLQSAFETFPKSVIEASYLAGKGKLLTLFKVVLPSIKPTLATAVIITFAHTLGEFGVVLMVGGSIPNETKVASIAIYELVESLEYEKAHLYSLAMVVISFLILGVVYWIKKRERWLK
ncbi:MAG: molybdate ABC transporter permease subunit [Epsilonproteobacteria bacterium]|nr:molybdate ABC transporter permease subunit [Campylobacterota bacterium]